MNNDLLISLSVKLEKLNNTLIILKKDKSNSLANIQKELKNLKSEVEKTNELLEKIYQKM